MKPGLLKRGFWFFLLMVPIMVGIGIVISVTSKSELFLSINKVHHPVADQFFGWITWLGSGWVFAGIVIWALCKNYGQGILAAVCFTLAALVPQLLKKQVFTDSVRPTKFFEGQTIHLVEGVKQHSYHSFPSGHATSAFTMFLLLTLLTNNRKWGLVFAISAVLVAFSRVYLAQHFLEDVYAGMMIGIGITMISFILLEGVINKNPRLTRRGLLKKNK